MTLFLIQFAVNSCLMKLFMTKSNDIVHACMNAAGCFFTAVLRKEKKRKFLGLRKLTIN